MSHNVTWGCSRMSHDITHSLFYLISPNRELFFSEIFNHWAAFRSLPNTQISKNIVKTWPLYINLKLILNIDSTLEWTQMETMPTWNICQWKKSCQRILSIKSWHYWLLTRMKIRWETEIINFNSTSNLYNILGRGVDIKKAVWIRRWPKITQQVWS